MKIPSLSYLSEAFESVLRRFPLPMLAALIGTVTMMLLLENDNNGGIVQDRLIKIALCASLSLPLLLSAAVAAEKWQWSSFKKWLPSLLVLGLIALYYFTLPDNIEHTGIITPMRFAGLLLVAHLLVAYVPYLDSTPVEDFWEYNKRLFGNFIIGGVYCAIIQLGLSAAILAVDQLFNLDIDGKIYGHLFFFIAGVINTSYFLANFPRQYEGLAQEGSAYNAAFKNLSKFILIPIVGIYFLIVYAYGVKILATWSLPHGWVSSLVLGFSMAGILTYLLNYLLVKYDDSALVSGYRRWFFYGLLPLVALLFVAVGRRLSDYGFTEERFMVFASGLWLALICGYFIFSKKDNIKFIPISLSVAALLAVLGPLSAFKVSERSQTGQLKSLLEKHGMFADGKVTAAKDSLPAEDAEAIRTKFQYLGEHEHFKAVAEWFDNPPSGSSPGWGAIDSLLNGLKVSPATGATSPLCYFTFDENTGVLDVAGYEKMYRVYLAENVEDKGWKISEDRQWLIIMEAGLETDRFNIQPFLEDLHQRFNCVTDNLSGADGITRLSGKVYEIRLELEDLNYERQEKKLEHLNGTILLRKKR